MNEYYKIKGSAALDRGYEKPSSERAPFRRQDNKKQKSESKRPEVYVEQRFVPSINIGGFFVLCLMAGVILYSSGLLLGVYSEMNTVTITKKNTVAMMKKLKVENDNLENKLYSKIDLEKIRDKAINDLGMMYPYKSNVISYQAVSSGYVRQFGEINQKEEMGIIKRILSKIVFW